jgi:DNA-directed RNA polymerase specialized sigma subunit
VISPIDDIVAGPPANPVLDAYTAYQAEPTPARLNVVVDKLSPTISHALAVRNLGGDPTMETHARVVAARAIKSYDPNSGAALPTWVSTQMQRLNRDSRMSTSGFKLPDRIYTDAMALKRAEQEFLAEHDREPDALELSDRLAMPVSRITAVRQSLRKVAPAGAFGGELPSGLQDAEDPQIDEALDYVYHDSDQIDRQLLEMRTGYGGKYEPMEGLAIATRLNIHPSDVSRRTKRLALRITKLQQDLAQAYGSPNAKLTSMYEGDSASFKELSQRLRDWLTGAQPGLDSPAQSSNDLDFMPGSAMFTTAAGEALYSPAEQIHRNFARAYYRDAHAATVTRIALLRHATTVQFGHLARCQEVT